jgi:hypothetical protein
LAAPPEVHPAHFRCCMSYSDPPTWQEVLDASEAITERHSRGYVADAFALARWILTDGRAMVENLARVQTRCTELLEENRKLKEQLRSPDNLPDPFA